MQRIGLVGGSFNPIHIAHLIIADRFVEQMELDVCYFVPANQSPFKAGVAVADATPQQRLEMVRRAIGQHPRFRPSDVEIDRGGISYTIDTVRHFTNEHPGAIVHLLIGSDQAIEFVRWKEWDSIVRESQLCIVRRPFLLTPEQEQRMTENLTIDGKQPIWVSAPLLEISSTEIRHRVTNGRTINYMTVKNVRDYIAEQGLYRAEA